jgi:hypothetical protein
MITYFIMVAKIKDIAKRSAKQRAYLHYKGYQITTEAFLKANAGIQATVFSVDGTPSFCQF